MNATLNGSRCTRATVRIGRFLTLASGLLVLASAVFAAEHQESPAILQSGASQGGATINLQSPGAIVGGLVHFRVSATPPPQWFPGGTGHGLKASGAGCVLLHEIWMYAMETWPDVGTPICWNTLGTAPGSQTHSHPFYPNGVYNITGWACWTDADETQYQASTSTTVELRNLTVTPVTPDLILKKEPGLGAYNITSTLTDGKPIPSDTVVEIRDLTGTVIWSERQTVTPGVDGIAFTVGWDGSVAATGEPAPIGVYSVRVHSVHTDTCEGDAANHPGRDNPTIIEPTVVENPSATDEDTNVSPLTVTMAGQPELVAYDQQSHAGTVRVRYTLSDTVNNRAASECTIVAYDPDVEERARVDGGTTLNQQHQVDIPLTLDKDGMWYFVVRARDDGEATDKAHRKRWAITKGSRMLSGPSSATLRLYKVAKDAYGNQVLGEECGAIIGGNVFAVLELTIGGQERLDPSQANCHIRAREGSDLHAPGTAQTDFLVNLATASGWEKRVNGVWQPSDVAPSGTDNRSGTEALMLRTKVLWDTTTQPLGHNGTHTVSLAKVNGNEGITQLGFQRYVASGWGPPYTAGPAAKTPDVRNLVITDVLTNAANEDYIKFDPDSGDNALLRPTITFNIEDQGDPGRCRWTLWVRDTRNGTWTTWVTCEGIVDGPGPVTVVLNDPVAITNGSSGEPQAWPRQYGQLQDWGTYAFDVYARQVDDDLISTGDAYRLKSVLLTVPETMPGIVDDEGNPLPGHDLVWCDDTLSWQLSYYLLDSCNATSAKADLLDGHLLPVVSGLSVPPVVNTPHLGIALYAPPDGAESLECIALLMAEDAHGPSYRTHANKRMLAVNRRREPKVFHIEDDWMNDGQTELNALARCDELKAAFQAGGWGVRVAPCPEVLGGACTQIPFQYSLPTDEDRKAYSRTYFFYYDHRHSAPTRGQPHRYVHVVGASYAEHPNDGTFGWSIDDERYSFTFIRELLSFGGGTMGPDPIKKTTIHEVGHQLGLGHHDSGPLHLGANGLMCVMYTGFPGNISDNTFCADCIQTVKSYRARGWGGW